MLMALCPFAKAQQAEKLDRGVVAVKTDAGVYVSWRSLAEDPAGQAYDVYRDGVKINAEAVTRSTNFVDAAGTADSKYVIKAVDASGGVVEEEALAAALTEGRLRGAGIDVLDTEPMRPGHPYLKIRNCYVTPHVAWAAMEARIRLIDCVAENLRAFLAGHPIHQVNR